MNSKWDWTPLKLVQWITGYLKEKNLPSSHRLEAELIVAHALKISRLDIYLKFDEPCTPEELTKIKALLKRRVQREPLAYILGNCEFWTLNLSVRPGVLIPRQDTETLIEAVLDCMKDIEKEREVSILELGTGSGAIPLAISMEKEGVVLVCIEKSEVAAACARENFDRYREETISRGNSIELIEGDGLEAVSKERKFDFIVSNPPYIPTKVIDSLQPEVSRWEPREALDGGVDGLEFYQRLKNIAPGYLKEKGVLIVEHGFDQAETLQKLFTADNLFSLKEQRKDLTGNDRVLVLEKV